MTDSSSSNYSQFCQAKSVFVMTDAISGKGRPYVPSDELNAVKFEEPMSVVHKMIWNFDDPMDDSKFYMALFGELDVSNNIQDDGFQLKAHARALYHLNMVDPIELNECIITHKKATIILAGNAGKCGGVFAYIMPSE